MCAVLERVNPEAEKPSEVEKLSEVKTMLEKILSKQTPPQESNFESTNKFKALEEADADSDQGVPLADPD